MPRVGPLSSKSGHGGAQLVRSRGRRHGYCRTRNSLALWEPEGAGSGGVDGTRNWRSECPSLSVFVPFVPIVATVWGVSPQPEWQSMSVFVRLTPFRCNCVTSVSGPRRVVVGRTGRGRWAGRRASVTNRRLQEPREKGSGGERRASIERGSCKRRG
jgi:hypothetical protein